MVLDKTRGQELEHVAQALDGQARCVGQMTGAGFEPIHRRCEVEVLGGGCRDVRQLTGVPGRHQVLAGLLRSGQGLRVRAVDVRPVGMQGQVRGDGEQLRVSSRVRRRVDATDEVVGVLTQNCGVPQKVIGAQSTEMTRPRARAVHEQDAGVIDEDDAVRACSMLEELESQVLDAVEAVEPAQGRHDDLVLRSRGDVRAQAVVGLIDAGGELLGVTEPLREVRAGLVIERRVPEPDAHGSEVACRLQGPFRIAQGAEVMGVPVR